MKIQPFFDKNTSTITYIVLDESSKQCAIIDSVLDYQPETGRTSTHSADALIAYIQENDLSLQWILETHIHADHLTAAHYLKQALGGQIGIGEKIIDVLEYWAPIVSPEGDIPLDGSQFDHLFQDNQSFCIGQLKGKVMFTPGHTPACVSYLIEDAVFVGDTIFMPYMGTARADFPGGDAKTLYQSILKILSLDASTRLFICHDYPKEGDAPSWETTVDEQKKKNIFINESISEESYVQRRKERDNNIPAPRLLLPSIQTNLRAGALPPPEKNGIRYLKIPLNQL